jgi:hypothetical protein
VRTWVICRRLTARPKARGHFSVPVMRSPRHLVPGQNEITGKNGDWIQGAVQLTQKRNAISAPSLLLNEIRARFISLKYNIALRQVRRDA